MLQQLAVACLIHDVMKTVVQLRQLIQMPLSCMELRQIHILLHLLHLSLRDMLRSPPGTESLQQGTNDVDVLHVLLRDSRDIGPLVGYDLNQSLQLQLTEGLPYGSTADPHLFTDGHLLQFFVLRISSAQNICPQLAENPASQRILIGSVMLCVIMVHFLSFHSHAVLRHNRFFPKISFPAFPFQISPFWSALRPAPQAASGPLQRLQVSLSANTLHACNDLLIGHHRHSAVCILPIHPFPDLLNQFRVFSDLMLLLQAVISIDPMGDARQPRCV